MIAGERWQARITVDAVENGYYNVTADALTHGPERGFHVFDKSTTEAWLFITDGGGVLTRGFDDSLFADRFTPVPGPLRTRLSVTQAATPVTAASVAAASRLYVSVVCFDFGKMSPAVGATIEGAIYDPTAPDADGEHYQSLTVPNSGVVSWPCPSGNRYLEGRSYLAQTSLVGSAAFAPHFDGTGCGDTIQVTGNRYNYYPWKHLNDVIPRVTSHFNYSRSRVNWRVDLSQTRSIYRSRSDRITFGSHGYFNEWIAAHEYIHALQKESLGGIYSANNCNLHYIHRASSYECALQEGFADYGGSIGAPNSDYMPSWEPYHRTDDNGGDPGEIEGNVAALFHDLVDGGNETDDETDYTGHYVAGVYRTCEVRKSRWFLPDVWKDRRAVADIVWCLENRVNKKVHENNFPNLDYTPNAAREGVSQPSNWNADDIRTTWLKNVGT